MRRVLGLLLLLGAAGPRGSFAALPAVPLDLAQVARASTVVVYADGAVAAGLVVWQDDRYVDIATAGVLRSRLGLNPQRSWLLSGAGIVDSWKMIATPAEDVLLLRVELARFPFLKTLLSDQSRLAASTPAMPTPDDELHILGHPGGRLWLSPRAPAHATSVKSGTLWLDSCGDGDLGAGVFDRNWELLGIITQRCVARTLGEFLPATGEAGVPHYLQPWPGSASRRPPPSPAPKSPPRASALFGPVMDMGGLPPALATIAPVVVRDTLTRVPGLMLLPVDAKSLPRNGANLALPLVDEGLAGMLASDGKATFAMWCAFGGYEESRKQFYAHGVTFETISTRVHLDLRLVDLRSPALRYGKRYEAEIVHLDGAEDEPFPGTPPERSILYRGGGNVDLIMSLAGEVQRDLNHLVAQQPIATERTVRVTLERTPDDADILLDNAGMLQPAKHHTFVTAAGPHDLRVSHAGYKSYGGSVFFLEGLQLEVMLVAATDRPTTLQAERHVVARSSVEMVLRSEMPAIREEFTAARRRLSIFSDRAGHRSYQRSDVLLLIDETNTRTLRTLSRVEVTALKDEIKEEFAAYYGAIERMEPAGEARTDDVDDQAPRPRHAAFFAGETQKPLLPTSKVDKILDLIGDLLSDLVKAGDAAAVELCVVSEPPGAEFSMHPLSSHTESYALETDGTLPEVAVGKYVYKVKKSGYWDLEYDVEFLHDRSGILECPLIRASTATGPRRCQRRERTPSDPCEGTRNP